MDWLARHAQTVAFVRASLLHGVVIILLAMGLLAGCKKDDVAVVNSTLRFDPEIVEFDPAWPDGAPRERQITVVNESRATVDVEWSELLAPFTADLPGKLEAGSTTLTLRFSPTLPGSYSRRLQVRVHGSEAHADLGIAATAKEIPICSASSPCVSAHFDTSTEKCVEAPLDEGTVCDSGSKCLVNAHCSGGRCVGDARTCDDQNLCTIDVCYPLTGCEYLPAPPCPGDGACMEGVCRPETGCGLQPREDGSPCGGFTGSCTEANVCIAGVCDVRDPPDGFVCQEASPCSSEGRCLGDVCVMQSQPQALSPSWSLDTVDLVDVDAGTLPPHLHDFVLEPTGAMSLSGFFDVPAVLRANTADALAAPLGPSRRCILWNTRYVCADYPSSPNGKVTALELATGTTAWTFDIRAARPDFMDVVSTIFLARLVVQDSDRLAAVFEAYPRNVTGDSTTQCRRYFLAVINASGQLVQAAPINDPLFDTCNHPHPYGVAADWLGNLFIAYSPTVSNSAPLVPDNTTLIISFSRDGVFRWKRLNTGMRGGELAVARGLLYAEYTSVILDATSGQPLFALPHELGRAVISQSRLIPAPLEGGTQLEGYEAGTSLNRWTSSLPVGRTFWSDQIRLAKWQTSKGARTVALTWVKDQPSIYAVPTYALQGFDVIDGQQVFTCQVNVPDRTPPQLFEVANGSIGMMNGALDSSGNPGCNKCDPPLAGSAGAFFSIPTTRLSQAIEPWVGTFGGAGHDHREN